MVVIQMREFRLKSWLVQTLVVALVTINLISGSNVTIVIASVLAISYTCIADYSSCLLLLMSITIFENSFKLSGVLVWIFLLLVLIARLFITEKKLYASPAIAALFIVLISLETIGDIYNVGINGQTLSGIVLVLFSFLLFSGQYNVRISSEEIVIFFGTSYAFAMVYLLTQYGGLGSFIRLFSSLSNGLTDSYRFGIKYGGTVGGAMAIPIYSLLILAFSVNCLLQGKTKKTTKLVIIAFDIVAFVFGALTVSRSFFLGLIILVALYLISKTEGKGNATKKILAITVVAGIACFFVVRYQGVITQVIDNLFNRVTTDNTGGTGGRTEIWGECLTYLCNHPLHLLLGNGTNGYPIVGQLMNKEFSAGSHNLYIDIIMSWGVIGAICVLGIVLTTTRPSEIVYCIKKNTVCVIPFIVLAFFAMTALRSNSMKTHVYFFMTLNFIRQSIYDKGEENDT